jgi:hypothetical protein
MMDKNGTMPRGQYLAALAVQATVLGALSYQLKNIAQGKDPEKMSTVDFWAKAAAIAVPWAVFFLGWIAAGLLTPSGTDNTPIRTPGPLDAEHVLGSQPHDLVEA